MNIYLADFEAFIFIDKYCQVLFIKFKYFNNIKFCFLLWLSSEIRIKKKKKFSKLDGKEEQLPFKMQCRHMNSQN